MHFEEGSRVKKGELLFSIDAAPFLAEVNRLEAEHHIAVSQAELAEKEFERAQRLISSKAISDETRDTRQANLQQANAKVLSLKAALLQAELQLDYTQITAPIDGVVSKAFVTAGNYVTQGDTVLTTWSQVRIYAYFDISQDDYLNFAVQTGQANAHC